jgi:dsRNA-specific ribonuclease
LEADFDIVNRVILDLFKEYIESINPNDTLKDFKTQLHTQYAIAQELKALIITLAHATMRQCLPQ